LIAFVAGYPGGDLTIDRRKIESTGWFGRDRLPALPGPLSISRALINWWIEEGERGAEKG
jgi:NAD+ diphosphatase